ncbi:mycothiol transferase [Aestuariimicrobium ganziense]|uniref:mycothiol transferase n=1 Tax=Aestuariimicrobium ganziense TaxID=2773677 RepID=UPI0019441ADA|nr:DUF664 domain-containing protein [Aestuariimicrobium ganziense]
MPFLTPQAAGEREVLKTYALQQLAQLRSTVVGLTDEQARSTPSASSLSLLALLAHGAEVAVEWVDAAASAPEPPAGNPYGESHSIEECAEIPTPLPQFLEMFDERVAWAASRFDEVDDLSAPVPVPEAPWFPKELGSWEARWVLLHVVSELARHAGHADIIRESIDGKGSYELNDLADGIAAG